MRDLMDFTNLLLLSMVITFIAFLYSSVGQGGGSGYIAIMGLFGLLPEEIKPTALILNILVAGIGCIQFYRSKHLYWSNFWPFAIGSIPLAYFGGSLVLSNSVYNSLTGVFLLISAALLFRQKTEPSTENTLLPIVPSIGCGLLVGLLSGISGLGGGVFLAPLLIVWGRMNTKQITAISAFLTFSNSISGILGHLMTINYLPEDILFSLGAATIGGFLGSYTGSKYLKPEKINILLALVLVVAGIKLIIF
ncbi:MAG TPA: hypothetical protein DDY49_01745 [Paenibacillaceae bacterium]|nr:hypothetical protein [Paenibacillaceae bacterium]